MLTNGMYYKSVLQKYPHKFVGLCLADPTEGGGGVKELERLVEEVLLKALIIASCAESSETTCWTNRDPWVSTKLVSCG